jgi:hypothetical protein
MEFLRLEGRGLRTEADAREALSAFIAVRRKYVPRYAARASEVAITPEQLAAAIHGFVLEDSEGGKCAQAVYRKLESAISVVKPVEDWS